MTSEPYSAASLQINKTPSSLGFRNFIITAVLFVLISLGQGLSAQTDETWDGGDKSDDWSQKDNWGGADPEPKDATDTARFTMDAAANETVNVDENNVEIGHMILGTNTETDNWIISTDAGRTLTFDNNTANATLLTRNGGAGGTHDIQVDLVLNDTLVWSQNGTNAAVTISGDISSQGPSDGIIKDGNGTANLTGALSFEGDLVVQAGTLNRNGTGVNADLFIGEFGGNAQRVTVETGGDIVVSDALHMGGTTTSIPSLVVDGNGSTFTVSGSSVQVGQQANSVIDIQNGGDFIHNGTGNFRIGEGTVASGDGVVSVTGNGSTLNVNTAGVDIIVGNNSGDGTLRVSNSATVTVADQIRVADEAASSGRVTVQSGGDLSIGGIAYIGDAATGSMIVTGSNSSLSVTADDIYVGDLNGSNGLLEVAAGALINNTGAGNDIWIGDDAGSIGSVRITGNGTTGILRTVIVGDASGNNNLFEVSNSAVVTMQNALLVGQQSTGNGHVTIASGGDITVSGDTYSGNVGTGEIVVTGSNSSFTSATTDIYVGSSSGSNGALTLSGGALLTNTGTSSDFYIGSQAGSIGSVTVTGNGTTALLYDLYVGDASANANVMVVSSNARLDVANTLEIADDANSNGRMTILSGADLTAYQDVSVGNAGTGALVVSGSGSSVNIETADLQVGNLNGSYGDFILSSGALLQATSAASDNGLYVGVAAGSYGTASITGNGTTAIVDSLRVGELGHGDAVISNTATVAVDNQLIIGTFTGSDGDLKVLDGGNLNTTGANNVIGREGTGVLTVSGTNSSWTAATDIIVGEMANGNGLVTIAAGGLLTNTSTSSEFTLGNHANSIGSAVITGNGTTALLYETYVGKSSTSSSVMVISNTANVSNAADFFIGNGSAAEGVVSVVSGASLDVDSHLRVGAGGTGYLNIDGSGSTVNNNTANGLRVGSSTNSFGSMTITNGGAFNGVASYIGTFGTGHLTVTGSGSSFNVANNTIFVSEKDGSEGYMTISAGALLSNTGTSGKLVIGEESGSLGSALITGAGTTALLREVNIGDASANANAMNVADSAYVNISTALTMGQSATGNGTMTVSGNADVNVVDDILVGNSGTGSLTITGSGSSVTGGDLVRIGNGANTKGVLNLSAGALLHATHDTFVLGYSAGSIGSATISGAGTTAMVKGTYVGFSSSEANDLLVTDTASITTNGVLYIANDTGSNGTMTVNNGSDLVVTSVTSVGFGGTGNLTLSGAGTTWTNTFGFRAGESANSVGSITINNGADATINGALSYIGQSGTGSLTIDGAGSTLTNSAGTINVGSNAGSVGTLTLSNGGTIEAATVNLNTTGSSFTADTIAIGNAAAEIDTLNINAGATASATTIDIGTGGVLNLNRSDGITGASGMLLSGGTFNTEGNDQAAGGLGGLTLNGNSVIDMNDGDSVINWTVLDETTWNGTLSIHYWGGTVDTTGGADQLRFTDVSGWAQRAQVVFYSDNGTTQVGTTSRVVDLGGGNWELIASAVPETSTYVGIGALLAFAIFFEIRRRKQRSAIKEEGGSDGK